MDIKQQIRAALYHAINRGENIDQAIISLINAGYDKEDVFEVANEILNLKKISQKETLEVPIYKKEKSEKKEFEAKKKEIIEKEKRKKTINLKNLIPNILSLIFILYYLIILLIKYKNFVTLIWILFGIPCLIINIFSLFKKINKKIANVLIGINLLSFIGLLMFIIVPNKDKIISTLKLLFSIKLFFIFPCFILAILLSIVGLFINSKINR